MDNKEPRFCYNSEDYEQDFFSYGSDFPIYDAKNAENATEENLINSYRCYMAAHNARDQFILIGRFQNITYRLAGIDKRGRADVVGPSIGELEFFNFQGSPEEVFGLDVPCCSSHNGAWSYKTNDSFILGAIHGGLPFYLASPRTRYYLACEKRVITTYTRELVGLLHFGYKIEDHGILGEVMICKDYSKAKSATLKEYNEILTNYSKHYLEQLLAL
ncbi:hypothetical protein FGO68_gene3309 [Halteria grandinella]|uniref:Uncharacterized protein n=1 Tax=Halteria grandinella TaxID=5974 RepID=A0A8J8P1C5_HALGN|nr:hypothetical protein FGO68_gene3309 [Halteria grandinella]